jgi:hypothetical protein
LLVCRIQPRNMIAFWYVLSVEAITRAARVRNYIWSGRDDM